MIPENLNDKPFNPYLLKMYCKEWQFEKWDWFETDDAVILWDTGINVNYFLLSSKATKWAFKRYSRSLTVEQFADLLKNEHNINLK